MQRFVVRLLGTVLLAACGGLSVHHEGASDDAGSGGSGAAGATSTDATCQELELDYARVVGDAVHCDVNQPSQCNDAVPSGLGCGCPVAVTRTPELDAATSAWKESGCVASNVNCHPCISLGSDTYCRSDGTCVFGGPATQAECTDLVRQYEGAVKVALECDPNAQNQCEDRVSAPFSCGCPTAVNDATVANAIVREWTARCEHSGILCEPCPPFAPVFGCAPEGLCTPFDVR